MKLFNGIFCALLGAAVIGSTPAKAADKPATNAAAAGSNVVTAPTLKLDDLLPDVTVARGKGFEIKRSQLDQTIVSIRSSIAAQGKTITPEQMPIVEVQCLDRLILVQILNGKATDAEKAKGKEEADKRLELFQRRGDVLQRQLKALGMTQETLYKNWSEEATFQEVLRDKVTVTDDQVKKFYDENPDKFQQPELVRVSHILFLTTDPKTGMPISDDEKLAKKKKADEAVKRAQAGEDFSKLVKDYSEDVAAKDDGGEIKFSRETASIPPEFISAAFILQTNQVSEVVTSQIGYHIVKLSEKIPAKKVDLIEVGPKIREYLQNQEVEKMLPKYSLQLKKDAGVEILDEKLKALEDAQADKVLKADAANDMKPKDPAK
jgi:peptidyl-prolyl cis-trans isomerase C